MDLTLFGNRTYRNCVLGGLIAFLVMFGVMFVVPFLLEDAMKESGVDFHSGLVPMLSHVEQDGNLLTGQNPHSSAALAAKLVEALSPH